MCTSQHNEHTLRTSNGLSDKRSDESVECGTSSPIDLTRLYASATSGRTQIGTSVSESGSSAPVIADPDPNLEEARRSATKAGKRGSLDEQAKSGSTEIVSQHFEISLFRFVQTSLRHE
jgi:hypothetical protein